MCFSSHINTFIHSSCHSSTSTWQSGCCGLLLVTVTKYYLQVIYPYLLDFYFGYCNGDFIRLIGYLLLTHSNPCTIHEKQCTNTPVTLRANQNKKLWKNFNNKILQIPSNLSHMFVHAVHLNHRCVSLGLSYVRGFGSHYQVLKNRD